jgi:hypothetical protein
MSMRSPSIVIRGALFIALPCLVFSGCKEKQPEPEPATASIAPVTRGDLASTLTVAGEFQPYQEVELGYWGAMEQKTRLRIQATSSVQSDGLRSGRNSPR